MYQQPEPTEEFLNELIQAEHNYLEGSTDPGTWRYNRDSAEISTGGLPLNELKLLNGFDVQHIAMIIAVNHWPCQCCKQMVLMQYSKGVPEHLRQRYSFVKMWLMDLSISHKLSLDISQSMQHFISILSCKFQYPSAPAEKQSTGGV